MQGVVGGRGVQKSQKCDDVIYEWSLTSTTCRDATAAVRLKSDCWKRIEIIPLLKVDTKELKSAENEFNLFNVRLTPKAGFHSIHF